MGWSLTLNIPGGTSPNLMDASGLGELTGLGGSPGSQGSQGTPPTSFSLPAGGDFYSEFGFPSTTPATFSVRKYRTDSSGKKPWESGYVDTFSGTWSLLPYNVTGGGLSTHFTWNGLTIPYISAQAMRDAAVNEEIRMGQRPTWTPPPAVIIVSNEDAFYEMKGIVTYYVSQGVQAVHSFFQRMAWDFSSF